MKPREWATLAFRRPVLTRRLLWIPALIWAAIAVGYLEAHHRFLDPMIDAWLNRQWEEACWMAWGDEASASMTVSEELDLDGLMNLLERHKASRTDQWTTILYTNSGPAGVTWQANARLASRMDPGEPGYDRAVAALTEAWNRRTRIRDFPTIAPEATRQPGQRVTQHRFSSILFLSHASPYIAWAVLAVGCAAALLPRPSEVASERRRRGLCIHCRYSLHGVNTIHCPECGTAQA
jgi:hypothetical protein